MRKRATEDTAVVAVAEPEGYDGLGEFDPVRAHPIVVDAVGRKMKMLAAYRDLDEEDLIQIGLEALRKAHPNYDPGRSKYTTFANMVVGRQMIDIWKVRSREYHRILTQAKPGHLAPVEIDEHEPIDPEDLAAWARNMVRLAEAGMIRYLKGLEPAQIAAVIAIQRREKWTPEETVRELRKRPDVLEAMGLDKAPPVDLVRSMSKRGLSVWFGNG